MGANAVPGPSAVFAAQLSNDAARGRTMFVFAQNEKLTKDDVIYMNYNGTRHIQSNVHRGCALPSEVSKAFQLNTDKPMLTLISCVPLGTPKSDLVFAEQISPDPSGATEQRQHRTASSTTIPVSHRQRSLNGYLALSSYSAFHRHREACSCSAPSFSNSP